MSDPISKIVLKYFRGASKPATINLDPKKLIVLFFGENGTGKSCIVDALDLVFNESSGSLGQRSSTSITTHLPTIGRSAAELSVTVTAGKSEWTGTLKGKKVVVTGPLPRPQVHILRRSQLLNLIEAQPADRYRELARFIDVEKVEKGEQSLRDAATSVNNDLDRAASQIAEATHALEELWKLEGAPKPNAIGWAKAKVQADRSALLEEVAALNDLLTRAEALRTAAASLALAEKDVTERQSEIARIDAEIAAAPGASSADAIRLIELLTQAQNYIAAPRDIASCPVCEQGVDGAELRASIAQRLSNMTALNSLATRRSNAVTSHNNAIAARDRASKQLIAAAAAVALSLKAASLEAVRTAIGFSQFENLLDAKSDPKVKGSLATQMAATMESQIAPLITKRDAGKTDCDQYNALKGYHDRIVKNEAGAKSLELLKGRMTSALTHVHDQRIKFTQGILDSVSGECNRLYSAIHPNESLGDSALVLDPERRASLHQQAKFEGHPGVPPQAYFSESHLDTLGFCVWLSIAKRHTPKDAIVVLDDVFTSVDSVHMTRIVNLVSVECGCFRQLIVMTHYRNWRDRYRIPHGTANVQLLELHRWNLARGIATSTTKLAIDELEAALATNPLDRQAVGSQAGILLEALLDALARYYRCRIALTRDGDYTLQEYLDGCASLFKKMEMEFFSDAAADGSRTSAKTPIKPLVDAILAVGLVRNQVGCHFNVAGTDISDGDVEAFGKSTLVLVKAVACPKCGDIPSRKKDTHHECGCGGARMHPLAV